MGHFNGLEYVSDIGNVSKDRVYTLFTEPKEAEKNSYPVNVQLSAM